MTRTNKLRATAMCLPICAAMTLGWTGSASAQAPGGAFGGSPTGPVVPNAEGPKRRDPAPPGLPGTKTQADSVAKPDKLVSDMPPTEALFDAINRGDMPTARDAINRGADLNGRNILGLSPTELSVDLGRNDITFLLLSLRGGAPTDAPSAAPAPRGTRGRAVADAPPAKQTRQQQAAARQAAAAQSASDSDEFGSQPAPAPVARAVPPPRQRLASQARSDGGAPIPQMGFLGFGGTVR